MVEALLKFPRSADVTWARDTGKSFNLGLLAFFLAYRLSLRIIISAPKLGQTDAILEWSHWAAEQILTRKQLRYDNRYELAIRGRGSITGLSGSETALIQSKHGHIVIVDEKQDMPANVVTESLLPMIGDLDGCMWYSGIGGDPASAGEILGKTAEYRQIYPWQEHVKIHPRYINVVNEARAKMLPEEFKAHYECKPLDISSKLLISHIDSYTKELDPNKFRVTAGIDWGSKLDRSVVTITFATEGEDPEYFLDDWLVCSGDYAQQMEDIVEFLETKQYDQIYSEYNGVGNSSSDILASMTEDVTAITVDSKWKTARAHIVYRKTQDKTMTYNSTREYSSQFYNDVTKLTYKFTPAREIIVEHSDFISSLMLSLEEDRSLYL